MGFFVCPSTPERQACVDSATQLHQFHPPIPDSSQSYPQSPEFLVDALGHSSTALLLIGFCLHLSTFCCYICTSSGYLFPGYPHDCQQMWIDDIHVIYQLRKAVTQQADADFQRMGLAMLQPRASRTRAARKISVGSSQESRPCTREPGRPMCSSASMKSPPTMNPPT